MLIPFLLFMRNLFLLFFLCFIFASCNNYSKIIQGSKSTIWVNYSGKKEYYKDFDLETPHTGDLYIYFRFNNGIGNGGFSMFDGQFPNDSIKTVARTLDNSIFKGDKDNFKYKLAGNKIMFEIYVDSLWKEEYDGLIYKDSLILSKKTLPLKVFTGPNEKSGLFEDTWKNKKFIRLK